MIPLTVLLALGGAMLLIAYWPEISRLLRRVRRRLR
jgi:hypothetical protein